LSLFCEYLSSLEAVRMLDQGRTGFQPVGYSSVGQDARPTLCGPSRNGPRVGYRRASKGVRPRGCDSPKARRIQQEKGSDPFFCTCRFSIAKPCLWQTSRMQRCC